MPTWERGNDLDYLFSLHRTASAKSKEEEHVPEEGGMWVCKCGTGLGLATAVTEDSLNIYFNLIP
jgi:hypothetical protein